jgi:hypothetical protein
LKHERAPRREESLENNRLMLLQAEAGEIGIGSGIARDERIGKKT